MSPIEQLARNVVPLRSWFLAGYDAARPTAGPVVQSLLLPSTPPHLQDGRWRPVRASQPSAIMLPTGCKVAANPMRALKSP